MERKIRYKTQPQETGQDAKDSVKTASAIESDTSEFGWCAVSASTLRRPWRRWQRRIHDKVT
jgi:hypothetical protein